MLDAQLTPTTIFNPDGNDQDYAFFSLNRTGLMNINNVYYKWARKLDKIMKQNFWIPEKYEMAQDVICYRNLSEVELNCYNKILSFLIFSDSIQVRNVPRVAEYIAPPEITSCLGVHAFQEQIHIDAYQYMLESLELTFLEKEAIYNQYMKYKPLAERNKLIVDTFNGFQEDKSITNFFKVLIANYILEGLFFYLGFNFFYTLASQEKMVNSATIIRIIQKDEETHLVLFENIIKEFLKLQYLDFDETEKIAKEMFSQAVEEEILFCQITFEDKLLGFSQEAVDTHVKFLANRRLKKLGYTSMYEAKRDPFHHLEKVKANFFESKVTDYQMSSKADDWDQW